MRSLAGTVGGVPDRGVGGGCINGIGVNVNLLGVRMTLAGPAGPAACSVRPGTGGISLPFLATSPVSSEAWVRIPPLPPRERSGSFYISV